VRVEHRPRTRVTLAAWSGDTGWTVACGDASGDGVLHPDEACDDGNRLDGDGCAYDCTLEP